MYSVVLCVMWYDMSNDEELKEGDGGTRTLREVDNRAIPVPCE